MCVQSVCLSVICLSAILWVPVQSVNSPFALVSLCLSVFASLCLCMSVCCVFIWHGRSHNEQSVCVVRAEEKRQEEAEKEEAASAAAAAAAGEPAARGAAVRAGVWWLTEGIIVSYLYRNSAIVVCVLCNQHNNQHCSSTALFVYVCSVSLCMYSSVSLFFCWLTDRWQTDRQTAHTYDCLCVSVCLSVCMSVCLSVCQSLSLSLCVCVFMSHASGWW